jgi:hypothetical protein
VRREACAARHQRNQRDGREHRGDGLASETVECLGYSGYTSHATRSGDRCLRRDAANRSSRSPRAGMPLMVASASDTHGATPRKRRWLTRLLWSVAVLACVGGLLGVVKSATFPRAIAEHPVRTEATVTATYINGLGGDPGVDYRYHVAGRAFTGSGDGKLGHEPLLALRRGDPVAIEYAANAPSESCTCDATREVPMSITAAIVLAAVLTLPLVVLSSRSVPRWRRNRQAWFEPVHGLGEWIGFLGGILVAVLFLLVALAYLIAPSVGG